MTQQQLKNILLLWLIIIASPMILIFFIELVNWNQWNKTIKGSSVYLIEIPKRFSRSLWMKFYEKWLTVSQERSNLEKHWSKCVVINGWYFGYITSGDFQPAGSLTMNIFKNNVRIINSTIDIAEDKNLTTILRYQKEWRWIIDSKNNPIYDSYSYYNLYAWPIVIKNRQILSWDIAWSTHGSGNFYRTFVAWYGWWKSYIWVTIKPMTLYELGAQLQSSLPGIDFVVNLDWWPSTSISSAEYSFNENQKLPRFFYVCN